MKIVCYGEALVEFTRIDRDGQAPLYRQGFGGDTSNTAIAVTRQDVRSGFVSALGDDRFGKSLRALWRSEGVDDTHVLVDARRPTGIYFINPDPEGRDFSYYRKGSAASEYAPSDLPTGYLAGADILHLSAISLAISASAREAGFAAIECARNAGVKVSFDTNLRLNLWPLEMAREVTHRAMALSHIALPSLDDSRVLTGLREPEEIARYYLDLGAGLVALKMGSEGVWIADGEAEHQHLPAFPVEPVDATGAGDAFDGIFLARYLESGCPFDAAWRALVGAALTTTGYGAVAPIPTRARILEAAGEVF